MILDFRLIIQCPLFKDVNADNADAGSADFRGFLVSETVLIRV
jgi:hypothetical protein